MSSGPLSIRRNSGAPRWADKRSRTATVSSAVMERRTSIVRASLVNSSVMFKSFRVLMFAALAEPRV